MNEPSQRSAIASSFQVSISSLTLGTLYEAVLAFSSKENLEALWPSVCQNSRWLIPSRRLAILLSGGEGRFEIAGGFEQGKFHKPADSSFTPETDHLRAALLAKRAQWIDRPKQQLEKETSRFAEWLFQDQPDLLFILPMNMKGKSLGALLFVMASVTDTDQAMLNTLGTIFTLHVGMTYSLLQITEERRQMQNRLIMQEKMASLGSLVAGIAHEINNPIGAVQSATDVVTRCVKKLEQVFAGNSLEEIRDDEKCKKAFEALKENTGVIVAGGNRISKMVSSLKNFARSDEAEYKQASLHEGIDSTLTLLQTEFRDRITVSKEYGEIPDVYCFPGQLNQVFMSLLQNASDAIEGKGTIRIKTLKRDGFIDIEISDSGKGVPADKLPGIFNFDFSRVGSRVKMGSGLVTAYNIVQRHGGEIKAASTFGEGSTFTITLPIQTEAPAKTD